MGSFWSIVDSFRPPQLFTTLLVFSMTFLFIYQHRRHIPSESFSFDASLILSHHQWWRLLISQLSHLSLIHLIVNMVSLWFLGYVERDKGHLYYAHTTVVLLAGVPLGMLAMAKIFFRYRPEWVKWTRGAGYSGVIFGWMTIYSMIDPWAPSLFNIYSFLLPWIYLFGLQLILWGKVSFIGHLSGILIGYLMSFYVFNWLDWYATLTLAIWATFFLLQNAKQYEGWDFSWLSWSSSVSGGRRMRLVDGRLQRAEVLPDL